MSPLNSESQQTKEVWRDGPLQTCKLLTNVKAAMADRRLYKESKLAWRMSTPKNIPRSKKPIRIPKDNSKKIFASCGGGIHKIRRVVKAQNQNGQVSWKSISSSQNTLSETPEWIKSIKLLGINHTAPSWIATTSTPSIISPSLTSNSQHNRWILTWSGSPSFSLNKGFHPYCTNSSLGEIWGQGWSVRWSLARPARRSNEAKISTTATAIIWTGLTGIAGHRNLCIL